MFSRVCLRVASASYMTALFPVPIEVARRIAPDDYFRVAEILPDQALFFVGAGEFRVADLGPYKELYVGFYTENRENPEVAGREANFEEFTRNESKMYLWKNWVTTPAALERMDLVGSTVFRRGAIERHDETEHATFVLDHADEGGVQLSVPKHSEHIERDFEMQRTHYGRLHGAASRCVLDLEIESMVMAPGQGELALSGRIAEECAPLKLGASPLASIWIDEMRFAMNKPVLLKGDVGRGDALP